MSEVRPDCTDVPATAQASVRSPILVWDWPVRLGHWALATAFALAWLTSENEDWETLHIGAGATILAIASFRLLWGLLGSRHARFTDFARGPTSVVRYLRSLFTSRPEHHVGHNPAGGWAILAMLALALVTGMSGWAYHLEWAGHWLKELHEGLAAIWLGLVVVHVGAVVVSSFLHRENLIRAMVTGYKQGPTGQDIARSYPWVAVLLIVWVAAVVWWIGR